MADRKRHQRPSSGNLPGLQHRSDRKLPSRPEPNQLRISPSSSFRDKKVRQLVKAQNRLRQRGQSDESLPNSSNEKEREDVFKHGFGASGWTGLDDETASERDVAYLSRTRGGADEQRKEPGQGDASVVTIANQHDPVVAVLPHRHLPGPPGEAPAVEENSIFASATKRLSSPFGFEGDRGGQAAMPKKDEIQPQKDDSESSGMATPPPPVSLKRWSMVLWENYENDVEETKLDQSKPSGPPLWPAALAAAMCIGFIVLGTILASMWAAGSHGRETMEHQIVRTVPPKPSVPTPTTLSNPVPQSNFSRSWSVGELLEIVTVATPKREFLTNSSPQGRALAWLVKDVVTTNSSDRQILQRYVLATLYFASSGDQSWLRQERWLTTAHECNWYGVMCGVDETPTSTFGNELAPSVTFIKLSSNALIGSLPSEVSNLPDLASIQLHDNSLSGTIPPALFTLQRLHTIFLNDNELEGGLPYVEMPNLKNLDLSENSLEGSLPTFLLSDFVYLRLGGNRFVGTIPDSYGSLQNLEVLDLADNELSSTIPSAIGVLPSLSHVQLYSNKLIGPIPNFTSEDLILLHFDDNRLSRSIPLIESFSLLELRLEHNSLESTIPDYLGSLSTLELLWLHENKLEGSIPGMLGHLKGLKSFHVYGNNLTGSVSGAVCDLKKHELASFVANCESESDESGDETEFSCSCCDKCSMVTDLE